MPSACAAASSCLCRRWRSCRRTTGTSWSRCRFRGCHLGKVCEMFSLGACRSCDWPSPWTGSHGDKKIPAGQPASGRWGTPGMQAAVHFLSNMILWHPTNTSRSNLIVRKDSPTVPSPQHLNTSPHFGRQHFHTGAGMSWAIWGCIGFFCVVAHLPRIPHTVS